MTTFTAAGEANLAGPHPQAADRVHRPPMRPGCKQSARFAFCSIPGRTSFSAAWSASHPSSVSAEMARSSTDAMTGTLAVSCPACVACRSWHPPMFRLQISA